METTKLSAVCVLDFANIGGIGRGTMKMKLQVTGVTKVTSQSILVQLQGKYGNAQLNLPISMQSFIRVGDEYTLDSGGSSVGELDETTEAQTDSPSQSQGDVLWNSDLHSPLGGRRILPKDDDG